MGLNNGTLVPRSSGGWKAMMKVLLYVWPSPIPQHLFFILSQLECRYTYRNISYSFWYLDIGLNSDVILLGQKDREVGVFTIVIQ